MHFIGDNKAMFEPGAGFLIAEISPSSGMAAEYSKFFKPEVKLFLLCVRKKEHKREHRESFKAKQRMEMRSVYDQLLCLNW